MPETDRQTAFSGTKDVAAALAFDAERLGDYRSDNVIVLPSGPAILAVLDWELSTLGDPLASRDWGFARAAGAA